MKERSTVARINIEEDWWSESRRDRLVRRLGGDSRIADGLMIQAWRLSQGCSKLDFRIPIQRFLCLEGAEVLLECDLADLYQANAKQTQVNTKQVIERSKQDEEFAETCYIYVRGSFEMFGWLVKRRQVASEGGKKSAKRPRNEVGHFQANAKQTQAKLISDQANVSKLQASSSSSCSSSYSYSEKKKRESTSLPQLVDIWNESAAKELPRIERVDPSGKRGKALKRRWDKDPDPEYWKSVISKINQSRFCLGQSDRGWRANIDWLCQPDTAHKVLEGLYDDRNGVSKGLGADYFDFLPTGEQGASE